MRADLSIIMPVLDEAPQIVEHLLRLQARRPWPARWPIAY